MNRQEKIDFIIDNYPEFNEDTPQEWIEDYKRELEGYTDEDEDIEKELEFVDYLLDK